MQETESGECVLRIHKNPPPPERELPARDYKMIKNYKQSQESNILSSPCKPEEPEAEELTGEELT